jgi:hypothetical protein
MLTCHFPQYHFSRGLRTCDIFSGRISILTAKHSTNPFPHTPLIGEGAATPGLAKPGLPWR